MTAVADAIADRIAAIDWAAAGASLDAQGFAPLPTMLDSAECDQLAWMYVDDSRFRSRIDMARYRFGDGEYKYFAAPLPAIVQTLRRRYTRSSHRSRTAGTLG